MDFFNEVFGHAKDFLLRYGEIVVFAGLFLENAAALGVFVPGITILIFAGYFIATGDLNPVWVLLAGYTATVAGDQVNFWIGRKGVKKLKFVKNRQGKVDDIQAAIENRNFKVMYLFQFPPWGRVLVPMTFGIMRFPLKRWLMLDLIASALFVVAYVGGGYALGTFLSRTMDEKTVGYILQGVLGGIVIIWLIGVGREVYKRWKARDEGRDPDAAVKD